MTWRGQEAQLGSEIGQLLMEGFRCVDDRPIVGREKRTSGIASKVILVSKSSCAHREKRNLWEFWRQAISNF